MMALVSDTSTGWILEPFLEMGNGRGTAGFAGWKIMNSPFDPGSRDGALQPHLFNIPFKRSHYDAI